MTYKWYKINKDEFFKKYKSAYEFELKHNLPRNRADTVLRKKKNIIKSTHSIFEILKNEGLIIENSGMYINPHKNI